MTLEAASATKLVGVLYVKGGHWRGTCECGTTPQLFDRPQDAWDWVVDHPCPVMDPALDGPLVPQPRPPHRD